MLPTVRLFVIALSLLGPLTAAATAQGTSGTLPGPITTGDLHKYAAWLELSVPQRQAAESFHDNYKERFDTLRANDIQQFLGDMAKLQGANPGGLPERDAVIEFLDDRTQLLRRISVLDRRLFADLEVVLTDEQGELLPRLDLWRRRDKVHSANMGFQNVSGPMTDLVEIISQLDLDSPPPDDADKLLANWEFSITKRLEDYQQNANDVMLTLIDRLAEIGFDQQKAASDPEIMQSVMTIMEEVSAGNKALASEITKRTLRSARRIAAAMEGDDGRVFLRAFYKRTYPASGFAMATMDRPIEILLARKVLTDEDREAILSAHATLKAELDLLMNKAVDAIQDRNEHSSILGAFQSGPTGQEDPLLPLQKRAGVARSAATAALNSVLDADLIAASIDEAQAEADVERGGVVFEQGDIKIMRQTMAPTTFSTMSSDDAQSMKRLLSITPEQHDIFDVAFDLYREQSLDSLKDVEPGDQASVIDELDSRLLDNLTAILSKEQRSGVGRITLMRDRQRATVGLDFGYLEGSNEANVDLPLLLYRASFSEDHQKAVLLAIAPFEDELTGIFQERKGVTETLQKGATEFNRSFDLSEVPEEEQLATVATAQANWQETAKQYRDQLTAMRSRIAALNDAMLASVQAATPPETFTAIESLYMESAFPHLYDDPESMVDRLHRARKLDDLTIDQSQSLAELATSYPRQWETATLAMIGQERGRHRISSLEISGDPEYWHEYQTRQQEISRYFFERDELNLRAKTRLEELLSADQLAAIGAAPNRQ